MSKKKIILAILVILIIIVIGTILFMKKSDTITTNNNVSEASSNNITKDIVNNEDNNEKTLRDQIITADNFEKITEKIQSGEALDYNEDDFFYYTYATLSYSVKAMKQGITDTDKIYENNIYGKTLQQIIDEGKQFMKDENTTVEKFKSSLKQ